jgi:hypothetical protein
VVFGARTASIRKTSKGERTPTSAKGFEYAEKETPGYAIARSKE